MGSKKIYKISVVILAVLCFIAILTAYVTGESKELISAKDFANQETSPVRLLGRYSISDNDTVWFDYTLSGIEFVFTGKKCVVHFTSDFLSEDELHAVVGIFINDSESEAKRLEINKDICDYTVFKSNKEQTVVIKIVKLSEAKQGTFGITGLTAYGKEPSLQKTEEKDMLFQFVGDSITCGMGNETTASEAFTTLKENGNMTYGAIAARQFDADVEFVSYSGIGLIWSTSDDTPPMTTMYQYSGYSRGERKAEKWNAVRKPDAICINLGTNDAKSIKDNVETEHFKDVYKEFLKSIRKENPDSYLLVCYGPMNYDLEDAIGMVIEEYQTDNDDNKCGYLLFDKSLKEGSGVGGHPTVKTHINMAEILVEYLERQLW